MHTEIRLKKSSRIEKFADAMTHGVGLFFALVAFAILFILSAFTHDVWKIVGLTVYGMSLVSTYLASTIYHLYLYYHPIPNKQFRRFLLLFDHCSIFLLIAGTYTPVLLIFVRNELGMIIFSSVWFFTLAGIIYKFLYIGRFRRFSLFMYSLMGWAIVVAVQDLIAMVPHELLAFLLAGGLFYTLGIGFFQSKRVPFAHAIWHIFVLIGSIIHFLGLMLYAV